MQPKKKLSNGTTCAQSAWTRWRGRKSLRATTFSTVTASDSASSTRTTALFAKKSLSLTNHFWQATNFRGWKKLDILLHLYCPIGVNKHLDSFHPCRIKYFFYELMSIHICVVRCTMAFLIWRNKAIDKFGYAGRRVHRHFFRLKVEHFM